MSMVLELGCGGTAGAETWIKHSRHVQICWYELIFVLGGLLALAVSLGIHFDVARIGEWGHNMD
jgi:hypothetical protein